MNDVDLEIAFQFYGLAQTDSEESFKKKFHELAVKFHPDKGEFNSDVMFLELMKHKQSIENFFENQKSIQELNKKVTNDYSLYKVAKKLENDSILSYFKAREKNNNVTAPSLGFEVKLKEELRIAKEKYLELIQDYPKSLWVHDARDSISSIDIWLK